MPFHIDLHFAFETATPTDILLQFEAADLPEQRVDVTHLSLAEAEHRASVPAQDSIGERIWVRSQGRFDVSYRAAASLARLTPGLEELGRLDPHLLPGEAVPYLFDSRYCAADRFQPFVADTFHQEAGGPQIVAMRDWIADNIRYEPGASGPQTTAADSFLDRRGICRDFAHVLISLARAAAIPARYVSCYAPGVTPQDFHAVAEVFLADPSVPAGGAWHIVDATGMGSGADAVKIGVGRDAADVSFLTSFGPSTFLEKTVRVTGGG